MPHNTNRGRTIATKGHSNQAQSRPGPRPSAWITGPDPVLHRKYRVFVQQRNQALWRGEAWHIPFDAWCLMWKEHWPQRGRARDCYCMSRRDWSQPWSVANTQVITRESHARLQAEARNAGWRSVAQQRNRTRLGI